jgi:hypothetical protein
MLDLTKLPPDSWDIEDRPDGWVLRWRPPVPWCSLGLPPSWPMWPWVYLGIEVVVRPPWWYPRTVALGNLIVALIAIKLFVFAVLTWDSSRNRVRVVEAKNGFLLLDGNRIPISTLGTLRVVADRRRPDRFSCTFDCRKRLVFLVRTGLSIGQITTLLAAVTVRCGSSSDGDCNSETGGEPMMIHGR